MVSFTSPGTLPSLVLLTRLALGDTRSSVAARGLIFHLAYAVESRPTRNPVDPEIAWDLVELVCLDDDHRRAAAELIAWVLGSVQSWQPIFDAANRLLDYFEVPFAPDKERAGFG